MTIIYIIKFNKYKIMRNKNKLVMSGLMALVLGLGISGTALAYQGDFSKNGPNYTPEFGSQITEVMTDQDYEGWRDLMDKKIGHGRVTEVINKDNFPEFAKAWRLAHEGKIKEANVLRKELGLRTNNGDRAHNNRDHERGMGHRMDNDK